MHFSHIKALGHDVWGKSAEVIKLIDDARAAGQNVTANNYPWLASHTGLDAALVPRWASDGGAPAMLKRFDDPALMAKIKAEMVQNLDRRGGAQTILMTSGMTDAAQAEQGPAAPWTGKYLSDIAKEWKMDPLDAAVRILRESKGHASIVSFMISEADLENFMKQPWVVTSSDGGAGHPREYATFPTKYAVYVKQKHVIDTGFFIRHSSGPDRRHLQAGPARLSEARLFRRRAGVRSQPLCAQGRLHPSGGAVGRRAGAVRQWRGRGG